jgi:hypothetical protein
LRFNLRMFHIILITFRNFLIILHSNELFVYTLGGLGSFTPTKMSGFDGSFQLGVTRTTPTITNNSSNSINNKLETSTTSNNNNSNNNNNNKSEQGGVHASIKSWQKKDSDNWSGQSSFTDTDMLF